MEHIIISAVIAGIAGYIADSKGYNWKLWFLLSWSLGYLTAVPGVMLALCLRKRGNN